MKKLQLKFETNADGCGLQTFIQIKRNALAALYKRQQKDGSIHSYEVFKVKVVKKGSPLPGGLFVEEDYEAYPGKGSFGKTAYSCKTLGRAEIRYEELLKAQIADDNEEEEESTSNVSAKSSTGGKRGRKAVDRSGLKIPQDKFTIKQLEALNPNVSFALLYQHVRSLIGNKFQIVDTLRGGRGKPTLVYNWI